MEFPSLGQHCSEPTCNRLDFLPVKCDACKGVFCHVHMSYSSHCCIEGAKRDFQVPVCPLCDKPVPARRGEPPDIAVGAHIDADCKAAGAKSRQKVFNYHCNFRNCKKKEMIQLICSECKKNHCLSHRHPSDHECAFNTVNHVQALSAQPAAVRTYQRKAQYVQGSMSEDEALARAIQLSLSSSSTSSAPSSQQSTNTSSQKILIAL